jgi:hypothetical protein
MMEMNEAISALVDTRDLNREIAWFTSILLRMKSPSKLQCTENSLVLAE